MIDALEEAGVIGPAQGSKPREKYLSNRMRVLRRQRPAKDMSEKNRDVLLFYAY